MSLLNITSLEKAIENTSEPAEILNRTRKTITDRLKKDGSKEGGWDGMDCTLMCFNFKNNTIEYAAANNPLWIIRENTILVFAPDKMPVGRYERLAIPFTQHTIELQKGDIIYTTTDGIPDQFGGAEGKKFMYKRLKELLLSISHLTMSEQKIRIKKALDEWMQSKEQLDDITLIGIRV
jgi:serine phosphatase RsbU (regulator of sigma subunit)